VEEDEGVKQDYTHSPGEKDKWLRPVSAVNASSVPSECEEVESVLFSQSLFAALFICWWVI
jgi:hypothetical protein